SLLSPHRTNVGAYVQDRLVVADRLFLTAGARVERNASFGTRAVPRVAAAWRLRGGADATTLRASAGTGIKEPSFFQSFGVSFFARGNPNLKPERSRAFDLGIEQRLLGGRLRGEATVFHHDYLDQVAYHVVDFTTFQGSYVNLGRTRARGMELSVEAAPVDSCGRACASARGPRGREGPPRLEQRQGQCLEPPRPPPAGRRGGRRPAHDRERDVRPRGHARGPARAARGPGPRRRRAAPHGA